MYSLYCNKHVSGFMWCLQHKSLWPQFMCEVSDNPTMHIIMTTHNIIQTCAGVILESLLGETNKLEDLFLSSLRAAIIFRGAGADLREHSRSLSVS